MSYLVGLVIISITIGTQTRTAIGFLVLGSGLMVAGLMDFFRKG